MGYSIFSQSHLHLVGCKTNGQRRMVLINFQKVFDTINHKILLKKCVLLDFQQLNCLFSWFELYLRLPVFKWVSKINCCKDQLWSSTTIDRAFLAGRVPPLSKNLPIHSPRKILPQDDSMEKWTWGPKQKSLQYLILIYIIPYAHL